MANTDDYCGYCSRCKEFKDDDYGQWHIDGSEIKTCRGCRDCGHRLTTMDTVKSLLPELLTEIE